MNSPGFNRKYIVSQRMITWIRNCDKKTEVIPEPINLYKGSV